MFLQVSRGFISTLEHKFSIISSFSTVPKQSWDLVSSVCLERMPIITKDLSDFELTYMNLLNKNEFEISYKSDHEVKLLKDRLFAEELKKQGSTIAIDQVSIQTAQEFEDACNKEIKAFKLNDRITTKDLEKDDTSTNRQLSNILFLIVKQTIGNQPKWVLPQGVHKEGETMRQTAERILSEICGNNLQAKFLGNAPCGFYKYKYPKSLNLNNVGMKIFFFKAHLINGSVSEELCKNFKWLSYKELGLLQEDYLKTVRTFLIE